MNIGFDAKRAFHNASGLGNYSRFLIRILAEHFPEHNYLLFNPKENNRWNVAAHSSVQEINPTKKTIGSLWRSFYGSKKVEQHNLQVYHGLSNELPFGIVKSKAKKVVTIHDVIFKRYPQFYNSADRLIYDKKYKHALSTADTIVAISETTKEDIVAFYNVSPDKIKVVYQGCDPLFYRKQTEKELEAIKAKFHLPENFIVCVGTVEDRKNGMQILNALEKINSDIPIVFIGKATKYKQLLDKKIAQSDRLKKNVLFIEGASNEDVAAFYQMAKFSVYPSVFEGFGIPVLESIASGTPVITNENGCFREAGGKAAFYVDTKNANELARAINNLWLNNDQLQDLKSRSTEHLANFNEGNLAAQIMDIYTS